MTTAILIKAPRSTVLVNPHTDHAQTHPDVYDWLVEKNIAWSLITENDRTVNFIFINDQHAMLFTLRWS